MRFAHTSMASTTYLLDNVIRARRLHHKHFYTRELEYGHKAYIDHLCQPPPDDPAGARGP